MTVKRLSQWAQSVAKSSTTGTVASVTAAAKLASFGHPKRVPISSPRSAAAVGNFDTQLTKARIAKQLDPITKQNMADVLAAAHTRVSSLMQAAVAASPIKPAVTTSATSATVAAATAQSSASQTASSGVPSFFSLLPAAAQSSESLQLLQNILLARDSVGTVDPPTLAFGWQYALALSSLEREGKPPAWGADVPVPPLPDDVAPSLREQWLRVQTHEEAGQHRLAVPRLPLPVARYVRVAMAAYIARKSPDPFTHGPAGVPLLPGCETVYWQPLTRPLLPAHAIIVDHQWRTIVLVIRGTSSLTDLLADAAGVPVPYTGGTGHAGMTAISEAMMTDAYFGSVGPQCRYAGQGGGAGAGRDAGSNTTNTARTPPRATDGKDDPKLLSTPLFHDGELACRSSNSLPRVEAPRATGEDKDGAGAATQADGAYGSAQGRPPNVDARAEIGSAPGQSSGPASLAADACGTTASASSASSPAPSFAASIQQTLAAVEASSMVKQLQQVAARALPIPPARDSHEGPATPSHGAAAAAGASGGAKTPSTPGRVSGQGKDEAVGAGKDAPLGGSNVYGPSTPGRPPLPHGQAGARTPVPGAGTPGPTAADGAGASSNSNSSGMTAEETAALYGDAAGTFGPSSNSNSRRGSRPSGAAAVVLPNTIAGPYAGRPGVAAILQRLIVLTGGYRVLVTGHSLGAAVAALLVIKLRLCLRYEGSLGYQDVHWQEQCAADEEAAALAAVTGAGSAAGTATCTATSGPQHPAGASDGTMPGPQPATAPAPAAPTAEAQATGPASVPPPSGPEASPPRLRPLPSIPVYAIGYGVPAVVNPELSGLLGLTRADADGLGHWAEDGKALVKEGKVLPDPPVQPGSLSSQAAAASTRLTPEAECSLGSSSLDLLPVMTSVVFQHDFVPRISLASVRRLQAGFGDEAFARQARAYGQDVLKAWLGRQAEAARLALLARVQATFPGLAATNLQTVLSRLAVTEPGLAAGAAAVALTASIPVSTSAAGIATGIEHVKTAVTAVTTTASAVVTDVQSKVSTAASSVASAPLTVAAMSKVAELQARAKDARESMVSPLVSRVASALPSGLPLPLAKSFTGLGLSRSDSSVTASSTTTAVASVTVLKDTSPADASSLASRVAVDTAEAASAIAADAAMGLADLSLATASITVPDHRTAGESLLQRPRRRSSAGAPEELRIGVHRAGSNEDDVLSSSAFALPPGPLSAGEVLVGNVGNQDGLDDDEPEDTGTPLGGAVLQALAARGSLGSSAEVSYSGSDEGANEILSQTSAKLRAEAHGQGLEGHSHDFPSPRPASPGLKAALDSAAVGAGQGSSAITADGAAMAASRVAEAVRSANPAMAHWLDGWVAAHCRPDQLLVVPGRVYHLVQKHHAAQEQAAQVDGQSASDQLVGAVASGPAPSPSPGYQALLTPPSVFVDFVVSGTFWDDHDASSYIKGVSSTAPIWPPV